MAQEKRAAMIFLAGSLLNEANLRRLIGEGDFDFYAADGGLRFAQRLELPLRKILGDFDSAEQPALPKVTVYPCEKDQTDSALALDTALRDGYREIWLIAPFGGRLDHSVANLSLLERAERSGAVLYLYDGLNLAFLLPEGTHRLDSRFRYISFFPWRSPAILSLMDFKYPLTRHTLPPAETLGVSNEPAGPDPRATVHCGVVLCVCIENSLEEL